MSSSTQVPLWQGFKLYITQDAYTFQPVDAASAAASKPEILVIDRADGDIRLEQSLPNGATSGKVMDVQGIIGLIKLHLHTFLVVITSKKEIVVPGLGAPVFLATDFRLLPVPKDAKPSLLAHPVEKMLLNLLKSHLFSAPLYFSYGVDLGSSFQRQSSSQYQGSAPLWKRTDERFFWNRYLQSSFIEVTESGGPDVSRFVLPILFGFFETKVATINDRSFVYGVIARRSRHRAGTRYFSRGIDNKGNVSNFNETEQFIIADYPTKAGAGAGAATAAHIRGQIKMSYVQTRGSVPVYWAEVNNLRYKPDLLIMDREEGAASTALHFEQQVQLYGDNHLINLVNQKGYEKPVKEAYERAVDQLNNPKVHYTYYDFHHECKGMRFDRVMGLIQRLEDKGLNRDDFFSFDETHSGKILSTQGAVVRTNCMDCLDRTNVVQSTLAKWILERQLAAVGILAKGETLEKQPKFWFTFRNVWADHADVISKAYSGTGALKTDFTRTGKRSTEGAIQDGVNSMTRYFRNNFFDGPRQDAYDLFTGAWTPRKGVQGDKRALFIRLLPYIWLLSITIVFVGLLFPSMLAPLAGEGSKSSHTALIATFATIASVAFYGITQRGLQYVAWPTLNRPEDVMFYEGPGYSSGRHGRMGTANSKLSSAAGYTTARDPNKAVSSRGVKGRRGGDYDEDEK